jgi:hypothetical protein
MEQNLSPPFMELRGSLLCLQEPATGCCPESDESSTSFPNSMEQNFSPSPFRELKSSLLFVQESATGSCPESDEFSS